MDEMKWDAYLKAPLVWHNYIHKPHTNCVIKGGLTDIPKFLLHLDNNFNRLMKV